MSSMFSTFDIYHAILFINVTPTTTTEETLFCFASYLFIYDVPSVRNCRDDSVILPDMPRGLYLADGMHHVISRQLL